MICYASLQEKINVLSKFTRCHDLTTEQKYPQFQGKQNVSNKGSYADVELNKTESCVIRTLESGTGPTISRQDATEICINRVLSELASHTTAANSTTIEHTSALLYSLEISKNSFVSDTSHESNLCLIHGNGGVDLRSFQTSSLTSAEKLEIVYDVARHLVFLHNGVGAVHGDIKSDNIVRDKHGRCSLTDFNLSILGYKTENGVVQAITERQHYIVPFRAPELHGKDFGSETDEDMFLKLVIKTQPSTENTENTAKTAINWNITSQCDIWALGALVCALIRDDPVPFKIYNRLMTRKGWLRFMVSRSRLISKIPLDNNNHLERGFLIMEDADFSAFEKAKDKYNTVEPRLLEIMSMCLQLDPNARPTAVEILPAEEQSKLLEEVHNWQQYQDRHWKGLARRAWRIGSCNLNFNAESYIAENSIDSSFNNHANTLFNAFLGSWVMEYGDPYGLLEDLEVMKVFASSCLILISTVLIDRGALQEQLIVYRATGESKHDVYADVIRNACTIVHSVIPSLLF